MIPAHAIDRQCDPTRRSRRSNKGRRLTHGQGFSFTIILVALCAVFMPPQSKKAFKPSKKARRPTEWNNGLFES